MLQVARRCSALLLAAFILFAAGCQPSASAVSGRYTLEDSSRTGHLELKADGTLVEVVREGTTVIDLKGTWHFDGTYLHRRPCVEFEPDGSGSRRVPYCGDSVLVNPRNVVIVLHIDLPPRYLK